MLQGRKGIGGRPRGAPTKVVRLPAPIAQLGLRLAQLRHSGDIAAFLPLEARTKLETPLVGSSAACGFPSPADDHLDRPLDFNELLVENHASTFAVRIAGESMTGAGLFPGDIAIVNRAKMPVAGHIVLALLDGEFTIKRYRPRAGGAVLHPENPAFPDILVTEGMQFEIWGVITRSIRML